MSKIKMNRRGFMKACGFMAGYAVLGFNVTKEAVAETLTILGLRQKSVYHADANIYKIRKSQDNPMVKKLYAKDGFLPEGPYGHKAHELLHTHYTDRSAKLKAARDKGLEFTL